MRVFTLRIFLTLLLCFTLPAQICTPVPVPGTSITQSTLDESSKRGVLAPGVTAFASLEAFAMAFGGSLSYIPQDATDNKFWADFSRGAEYVTVNGTLDTSNPSTWSDFSMTVYGPTIARFYQDRAIAKDPLFRNIPRFVRFTSAEPAKLNLLLGVGKPGPRTVTLGEAQYPLAKLQDDPVADGGKRWSWATNYFLMTDGTGLVKACEYHAYSQAFPIVTTVSVGGTASGTIRVRGMTDEQFLQAVGSALFGGGNPAERAQKIIGYLEVR